MRVGVIAERDHEVRVAVMFEVFQQVPEDRLVTDEDHGLGLDAGRSVSRVPCPPANIATFIATRPGAQSTLARISHRE